MTLAGTEVAEIEPVPLDRAILGAAQFITEQCYLRASELSGIPSRDLMEGKVSAVRVLLEELP